MTLYTTVGAGNATHEAAALRTRLASWHDAMVTHERKIRTGRVDAVCDDECPHAEAQALWQDAVDAFGARAEALTFLRSRALAPADR